MADEIKSAQRNSRKRHHDNENRIDERESSKKSKTKFTESEPVGVAASKHPSPGQLTAIQVKFRSIFISVFKVIFCLTLFIFT